MKNHKVHYSRLNSTNIPVIEFTKVKDRNSYLLDKIMVSRPIVFILAIENENSMSSDIYVFDNWQSVEPVLKARNQPIEMFLFEYSSYEEAYKSALDMQEPNPLCYEDDEEEPNSRINIKISDN